MIYRERSVRLLMNFYTNPYKSEARQERTERAGTRFENADASASAYRMIRDFT